MSLSRFTSPIFILCSFFVVSCSPVYHDYNKVSTLEVALNSGESFNMVDVEDLHGGKFYYRIDYLSNGEKYTLEERTFDTFNGWFSFPPKSWYPLIFFYENNHLYGVIEPFIEERGPLLKINECFQFSYLQTACFEEFNKQLKAELKNLKLIHQTERTKALLREIRYQNNETTSTDEDTQKDKPSIGQLLLVPVYGVGLALMHTPLVIAALPPMGLMEANRKSSYNKINKNAKLEVGDNFQKISALVSEIPDDTKYFIGETGIAYYEEAVSGNPVFSFGVQEGTVVWTRKCIFNAPSGLCPPLSIPQHKIENKNKPNSE